MPELQLEEMYARANRKSHGHFYCLSCKCNVNQIVMRTPNDNQIHVKHCPRCRAKLIIDPGIIALATITRTEPWKTKPQKS